MHCSFGISGVGGMEHGVCDRPNLALLGETTIPNRPVISILLADDRMEVGCYQAVMQPAPH